MSQHHADTLLARAGHYLDETTGAVTPSIAVSTTFARDDDYKLKPDSPGYRRNNSPTNSHVETLLAELEGGVEAQVFSSGLAAATSLFSCLKPGDHVVMPRVCYYALRSWVVEFAGRWGLTVGWYEAGNLEELKQSVGEGNTKLVWVETPANPSWEVVDIEVAAQIAHSAGAVLATDSTVSTPVLTRPIEYGADFVVHSATKYLNGHSDVLAGAIIAKEETEYWQKIKAHRTSTGAVLAPFEGWLLQRGMRTLHLRVMRASESALTIARALDKHQAIEAVHYPGLESHPGHDIAKKQMLGGFGGMLSLAMKGGEAAALHVVSNTRLFLPATSLGGVESLIEHRATIEGDNSPVPKNLLRLSVGAEHIDDLLDDLLVALDGV